jgi:hypothetical protein
MARPTKKLRLADQKAVTEMSRELQALSADARKPGGPSKEAVDKRTKEIENYIDKYWANG